MVSRLTRPLPLLAILTVTMVALALSRAIDHDESQYVAAVRLVADGLLPYRDFAYLQTPLQPFAFAPIAWLAGDWTWPALRIVNATLGAVIVAASWRAMRMAGVDDRTATHCAALLASCNILLFAVGTARNDALPAALLALALVSMLRVERGSGTPGTAMLIGLLLSAAAAAKISYALPAATYGVYALFHRRHRPSWVAIGALPPVAFVAWTAWLAPEGFLFGTLDFPARAPAEYYGATGRAWKLSVAMKAIDTLKFLALGPALLAVATVLRRRAPGRPTLLEWLTIAGFVAALLPSPTWRQYLLPTLPPLFVLLAQAWHRQSPSRRSQGYAAAFAALGVMSSLAATADGGKGLPAARAASEWLASTRARGTVATLSPQFLPNGLHPDARFATGPFYFRSTGLLASDAERRLKLVSRARIDHGLGASPPDWILVGGEAAWTSGDASLDHALERWAIGHGWRLAASRSPFRLYAATPTAARASIADR